MEEWLKEVILPFILLIMPIIPIILFMNYCMYVCTQRYKNKNGRVKQ